MPVHPSLPDGRPNHISVISKEPRSLHLSQQGTSISSGLEVVDDKNPTVNKTIALLQLQQLDKHINRQKTTYVVLSRVATCSSGN